jgi:O-antigen/teichoic acid export membrane protein
MGLSRNLVAGWINSAVTVVVGLAVVPAYVRLVGTEAYGLIGFFVTLQSLLQVVDLGFGATVTREVARSAAGGHLTQLVPLLLALGRIYAAIAIAVALVLMALAPAFSHHWLQVQSLPVQHVTFAMILAALALSLRCTTGLYQSVLIGAQRITTYSRINIVMTVLAQGGGVAVLACVSADLRLLFAWQACTSLGLALWLRRAAWRSIGTRVGSSPDFRALMPLWQYSAAVAGVNVIGLCLMQLDKVLLSKMLPLAQYGRYMLATVVTTSLYLLIIPVFNAIYPRFSALVSRGPMVELRRLYRLMSHLVATVTFPLAMFLVVFGDGIVSLWTGNAELAADVAPVIGLLAAGTGLHTVMIVVFALQLAMGASRLSLRISIGLLVVEGPLIWLLTTSYGVIGAAAAWLLLHVLYLVFGAWVTHRALLPDLVWRWLLQDVGGPFLITMLAGLAGWRTFGLVTHQEPLAVLCGATLAALTCALIIATSPRLRVLVGSLLQRQPA